MLENVYEKMLWPSGELVMGIDEAGRGPLCGPLVVACVIFDKDYQNDAINDSKKLSEKKRQKLFMEIIKDARYYAFRIVEPKEIDTLNIYAATKKAMEELSRSTDLHQLTITDAMPLGRENAIPIIKGDAKSISIAAASIVAKVTRDRMMVEYDSVLPGYDFASNKGYGSAEHIAALKALGPSPIHRRSFIKNYGT